MQTLRTYKHVARTEHWCDRCCQYILPGEVYEGTVVVYNSPGKHRLHVWKVHIYPDCDFPSNPEDDKDETVFGDHEMKIAA